MRNSLLDLFRSVCFWAPLCAWLTAQCVKMICGFTHTRRFDFSYLVSTGGMPSAHSAMTSGLATAVGLDMGFGAPIFVVALAFAIVTMFDASTVRNAAGRQARLLNEIMDELFEAHRLSEVKLKELLGHTRLEVLVGMAIGILVAMIVVSVPALAR
ncbi:MAG: divergent PAP2 family protein [Verrucomicrobiota bacterium]|nr:divergent PAP2 family protein [Verrucomicrobiota bacterium]